VTGERNFDGGEPPGPARTGNVKAEEVAKNESLSKTMKPKKEKASAEIFGTTKVAPFSFPFQKGNERKRAA